MNRFTHLFSGSLCLATTTLLLLLLPPTGELSAQRQSFAGYVAAADAASLRGDHYNAFRLYEIATEFAEDDDYEQFIADVEYKAGLSAYKSTAYGAAERHFLRVLRSPERANYPLLKYYLGQANFRQGDYERGASRPTVYKNGKQVVDRSSEGDYDQAIVYLQQFIEEQPNADERYLSRARFQIYDADWVLNEASRSDEVNLELLPQGINSPYSDVMYTQGPNGKRYFSTNRYPYKNDTLLSKRSLGRIVERTGETSLDVLPERINADGLNAAYTSFNTAGNAVVFSLCSFIPEAADDEDADAVQLRCDLYRADVDGQGEWGMPRKLSINAAGATTTHPSFGLDPDTGSEWLYFASNRSGGQGGLDLYRAAVVSDTTFGAPENLAAINTSGDDATPFWYAPRQTLFFSTDGRLTFGGLDLYRTYYLNGSFRRPINLGAPVNSSADDAYYSQFDEEGSAFMSSRRIGPGVQTYTGRVVEATDTVEEVCCYEIYEFTPDRRIDLLATTFNGLTQEELAGVTVSLYRIEDGQPPVLLFEQTNPDSNDFNFLVEPDGKYELRATKDGFTNDMDMFDLSDPEFAGKPFIERQLYLNPKVDLEVFTFNNVDRSELIGATVRLLEIMDDGSLRLIETKDNATANDFYFQLEQGKRYRVEGERAEFGTAFAEVDLRDYDIGDGTTIRRDLYLGQSLEVLVVDGVTDDPLFNATVNLQRIDGSQVAERTNPDGNDFYFTINLDQPFVLRTTRDKYYPRTDTLTFTREDLIETGGNLVYVVPLFNDDLNRFLPFEVYFDNDRPNPRTTRTTTDLTYEETYYPYIEQQPTFIEQFTAGMSREEAFVVQGEYEEFFNEEVRAGWTQLQRFAEALQMHLENGGRFELQLQGYASPRAATNYNERLSARRNDSVENYLETFRGGVLRRYIQGGQLTYVRQALGESTADVSAISDRLDRPRESVFSIIASLERRVQLSGVVSSKKKK